MSQKPKPELIKRLEKEIGWELEERTFKEIEIWVLLGFTLDGEGNVNRLNLNRAGLKQLPESLSGFMHLQSLNLGNNQLSNVSPLQGLSQLKHLILWYNQLTQ
ncbi:MAG: hypothetical protein GY940_26265 [bacterium]|nr:hypothetical protein [bacterium]